MELDLGKGEKEEALNLKLSAMMIGMAGVWPNICIDVPLFFIPFYFRPEYDFDDIALICFKYPVKCLVLLF